MSDIYVTLCGNVTDDPRQYTFRDGSRVTWMRLAVDRRVRDQQTNMWQTKETSFYTIRCYRGLADNVHQSIRKGHPVVVYGRLRIRQVERDAERDREQRLWPEVEAVSVGHDLKWGMTIFEKPVRPRPVPARDEDGLRGRADNGAGEPPHGGNGRAVAREANGGADSDEAWPAETVPMAA